MKVAREAKRSRPRLLNLLNRFWGHAPRPPDGSPVHGRALDEHLGSALKVFSHLPLLPPMFCLHRGSVLWPRSHQAEPHKTVEMLRNQALSCNTTGGL